MSTFEVSDVIRAPARDAWAYAADITRHPDWLNVADSRPTAGDGHAVGDRAMETIRFGPLT